MDCILYLDDSSHWDGVDEVRSRQLCLRQTCRSVFQKLSARGSPGSRVNLPDPGRAGQEVSHVASIYSIYKANILELTRREKITSRGSRRCCFCVAHRFLSVRVDVPNGTPPTPPGKEHQEAIKFGGLSASGGADRFGLHSN